MRILGQIIITSEVFLPYNISSQQKEKSAHSTLKMHITCKLFSNTYLKLRIPKSKFLSQD